MVFTGENLLIGLLGKVFIYFSFFSLIASSIAFIASRKKQTPSLLKTGKWLYGIHFVSLLGAVFALYYLIFNHHYEYSYVWQYSANDLPLKFLISCFWAGQEGSFLIWALFQGLIGFMVMSGNKSWNSWVMPVYSTAQIFIMSMLLGFKLGPVHLGGSPFLLLRDLPQNQGSEIFTFPNYLEMIVDGNGLNPLLENIWMIIHPPALFLGYAVTMVPFTYAVASLWKKDFHGWIKPAIRWSLASLLALSFGILLGGRWAYESLTFGGFWAWDPVENASLLPWLALIAGLHTLLIASKRRHSYIVAYIFTFLSWVLVVYATYLTRSGVLSSTSVHSFGDTDKALQMVIFTLIFFFAPLIMLFMNFSSLKQKSEDSMMSRDFWMLIGSIIVILSAFQITVTTSIPVINKLFGTNIAPPLENVAFYNRWQLPFAVIVSILIGVSQYLNYGKSEAKGFWKNVIIASGIALFLTIGIAISDHIGRVDYWILTFALMLGLTVSVHFLIKYVNKTSNIGAAITHSGFAIFLVGAVIAFSNSQVISKNTSGKSLGSMADNAENLVLEKGKILPMGNYMVSYTSSEKKGNETFYKVDFMKPDNNTGGEVLFSLYPSVNRNTRMGSVYNPDTKHFLTKDIFTFISFAQQDVGQADTSGFNKVTEQEMMMQDTVVYQKTYFILDTIIAGMNENDMNNASIVAKFRVLSMELGKRLFAEARYEIVNGQLSQTDAFVEPVGMKIRFEGLSDNNSAIKVGIYNQQSDYIVLKAVVFPFMNIIWLGAIIMSLGFVYSIYRRRKQKEQPAA